MGVVPFRKDNPIIRPETLLKLLLNFKKAQGFAQGETDVIRTPLTVLLHAA
jgi:hypothetical protein